MAILDILNRDESEFFSKVFKLEIDYFNRDLGLLLNNKIDVVQPSYDYHARQDIFPMLQKTFVKIDCQWEGECEGETYVLLHVQDAKIMCGLMMMTGAKEIKETLSSEFGADDMEIFKEIANQINGSMDNALREHFTFDFLPQHTR